MALSSILRMCPDKISLKSRSLIVLTALGLAAQSFGCDVNDLLGEAKRKPHRYDTKIRSAVGLGGTPARLLRTPSSGEVFQRAPDDFVDGGKNRTFVDFHRLDLAIDLNVPEKTALGQARIDFAARREGTPIIDMVPKPTFIKLNGRDINPEDAPRILAPDGETYVRTVDAVVKPGRHTLEIGYALRPQDVHFHPKGVNVEFSMSDVSVIDDSPHYLDRYAPSNFEYDPFHLASRIRVLGTDTDHSIFSNGDVEQHGKNDWAITHPDYFTTSSPYLHVTDRPMVVATENFRGVGSTFPITIYSSTQQLTEAAMEVAKSTIRELEATYGPFAHKKMIAYLYANNGGGMEHAGATRSSLWALGHEITHSWFARGVMPANGDAGWLDEAMASWRDMGYPRPDKLAARPPIQLSGFSPYRRFTTLPAYREGMVLMSELDHILESRGGLQPLLKKWYDEKKRKVVTTKDFQDFMTRNTGLNLSGLFDRYVYGKDVPTGF